MARGFNAQSDPGVFFKSFSASQQSMIANRGVNINTVVLGIVFCKYCSHHIKSPYR